LLHVVFHRHIRYLRHLFYSAKNECDFTLVPGT
jgi:hypothetical protein